ncbi:MAG: phenylalanine--tRNA ligase subunit alpha, partial [Chloroflexia bacterium]|nr:phenylalanine--tRNA ligase subunit alpha [Chloroflexia bacterium]
MSTAEHGLASDIEAVRTEALDRLKTLATAAEAAEWESTYLGPKGRVTLLLRGLGQLPKEERPIAGRATQQLRNDLTDAFGPVNDHLAAEAIAARLVADAVDISLPGRKPTIGAAHPISIVTAELVDIFALLG